MTSSMNNRQKWAMGAFVGIALGALVCLGAVVIHLGTIDRTAHWRATHLIVTDTRPIDGAIRVTPNSFIAADVNLPHTGHGVDPRTLTDQNVKLYRTRDRAPVPAVVNTSGAGDSIVLQPVDLLNAETEYTFEVTSGLKDTSGEGFHPFVMRFRTSAGARARDFPAAFEKVALPELNEVFTGLAIGPDRHLYAGTFDGKIVRMSLREDGTPGSPEFITTVQRANAGPRLITGVCFDPSSTAERPVLWVSHGQMSINEHGEIAGAEDWTGKISILQGENLKDYRDVVVHLPRGYRDHLNNQLAFGPDGAIYFSQASHTAIGAPDKKWALRPERLLSAAVLRLDPSRVSGTLDVKTEEGGTYDPFASDAPLTIHASGVRVGYDVLWHGNGRLYTAVNGSAAGGNAPATPKDPSAIPRRIDADREGAYTGASTPGLKNLAVTQADLLLMIEAGRYYGHPNPARGEFTLNGGNPTSDADVMEVSAYPVGTPPDRNWRPPAFNFGKSVSPNGLIEYRGRHFGEVLNGSILVTRYSGGDDILVLIPDAQGNIVEAISGIEGFNQFIDPLDLVQDEVTGNLYIAEYGGRRLTLVKPIPGGVSGKVFRETITTDTQAMK